MPIKARTMRWLLALGLTVASGPAAASPSGRINQGAIATALRALGWTVASSMDSSLEEAAFRYSVEGATWDDASIPSLVASLDRQASRSLQRRAADAAGVRPRLPEDLDFIRNHPRGKSKRDLVTAVLRDGHAASPYGAHWRVDADAKLVAIQSRTTLALNRRIRRPIDFEGSVCAALERAARHTETDGEHIYSRCRSRVARTTSTNVTIRAEAGASLFQILASIAMQTTLLQYDVDLNASSDGSRVAIRWFIVEQRRDAKRR